MSTLTYSTYLTVLNCGACAIPFALPNDFLQTLMDDGNLFWCPNGHQIGYGLGALEKERKRAEAAEQELRWAKAREARQRQERQAAERSARAYRGHLTRLRNRISAGVCPVQGCRRNFANVKAHIENKHPDWAAEHTDALT